MKHAVAMLTAVALLGCSNPTAVQWEGQGMTFAQAADQAVAETLRRAPLNYIHIAAVIFKYDDGGAQREGRVTASGQGAAFSWYVAPGQCQYAPAGYCDFSASEVMLPGNAPNTVAMPDIEGTFTWGELSGADRGIIGTQWNCDPNAEITFVCGWDGTSYRCRVNWGECSGWYDGD